MKIRIDDLPLIKASSLVARGEINRQSKTALLRFDGSEVEYQVGVRVRNFRNGGFWAIFVCPCCGEGAQRLRLLDGRPACGACVRASGLRYRTDFIRADRHYLVTAPPRIALLNSDKPLRVHARPGRILDARAKIEARLKRSLIVARKAKIEQFEKDLAKL